MMVFSRKGGNRMSNYPAPPIVSPDEAKKHCLEQGAFDLLTGQLIRDKNQNPVTACNLNDLSKKIAEQFPGMEYSASLIRCGDCCRCKSFLGWVLDI